MKKIAVVNDLSGLGRCSLTAALPVISAMGVQACPLPTAILSNQTGYSSYFCDDYTQKLDRIMDEWEKQSFWPDGIYTGFLAGERQVEKIQSFIQRFSDEKTQILVDPVMGDHGKAHGFCTESFCKKMAELAKGANVLTPNLTEAFLLLYGTEGLPGHWERLLSLSKEAYLREIEAVGEQIAADYAVPTVVITGIDSPKETAVSQIGNLVCAKGAFTWCFSDKKGGSFSGTGDLFASILCAGLVQGRDAKELTLLAGTFLGYAIEETLREGTDRNDGVCFEKYLYLLCRQS